MRVAARPSIAVIIPNWNDSRFLPRCLHSVLGDPEGADEVIVVDDKSTDETTGTIRGFCLAACTRCSAIPKEPMR